MEPAARGGSDQMSGLRGDRFVCGVKEALNGLFRVFCEHAWRLVGGAKGGVFDLTGTTLAT